MAEQDNTPEALEDVAPTRDRETGALLVPEVETPTEEATEPVVSEPGQIPDAIAPDVQPAPVAEVAAPAEAVPPVPVEQPIPPVETLPPAASTNWTALQAGVDFLRLYATMITTKVAEIEAFVAQESSKSQ